LLDTIEIDLRDANNHILTVYVDVEANSLSRTWLAALDHLIRHNYHLEKNYCWLGWAEGDRSLEYVCEQINRSIHAVNAAGLGYVIQDFFTPSNTIMDNGGIDHSHMNQLHRYFEDLQGVSGAPKEHYLKADAETRWHIRQLNLLCHEFESWALSYRKQIEAPEWQRPSQLMCWLGAPRFTLDEEDYELFGIDTINRSLGGVYVGVNKAVGKHHWEVFQDEGRDSRLGELTTTSLRAQTEAAGDFDIEWANNPGTFPWQIKQLKEFREWLTANDIDPENKALTIGHPQIGQVDLLRSFGTEDYRSIWTQLNTHLNVKAVRTSTTSAVYEYCWSDPDYMEKQIKCLG
jgi:hypothetical protein